MRYQNLIIDCNNLFWRSAVTCTKKLLHGDEEEDKEFYSITIQDCLVRIQELIKQFGTSDCNVYILHDNPFSKINEREMIYADYKHARKNKNIPPVFYKALEKLIEILKVYHNNFYILHYKGSEADDLVPIALQHRKGNCLLISADLDWARGIADDISWYNFSMIYTKDLFRSEYGYNPEGKSIQLYKAIRGDKSDCIENAVPYLPNIILLEIVNTYTDLKDMFSRLSENTNIPNQWKEKIRDNKRQIEINYQLTDYIIPDIKYNDIVFECKEDIEALRSWFLLIDLSFESRMMDRCRDASIFLEKKKFRRYGNF